MTNNVADVNDEDLLAEFLPIRVDALVDGTAPKFSFFIQPQAHKAPILYREKNLRFEGAEKKRLSEQGVETVWVPKSQSEAYHSYMEDHLAMILDNSSIPVDEKAQLLYGAAVHVAKELLENPETLDLPVRAYNVITNSVDFIYTKKASFEHFLKAGNFDYYTYTHSVQVMLYSLYLADHLGFDDVALFRQLALATFLHDIGKSRVPHSVLLKEGPLDADEWTQMKRHPEWGCEIVSKHGIENEVVMQIIRSHHEKLDGSGYPDGLTSEEIPDFVKLVTICDIFDALTTRRSYKEAMPTFQALKILQVEMEGRIDNKMLVTFIKMLSTLDKQMVS